MRIDIVTSSGSSQKLVFVINLDYEDMDSQPIQEQDSESLEERSVTGQAMQSTTGSNETLVVDFEDKYTNTPRPESYRNLYSNFPTANTPETPVKIQAGERHFTTFKTTLIQGSSYYRALFSGNWRSCPQPDGSYFVDIDGEYFAHLLKFLRHGVYPRGIYNTENKIDKEFYRGLLDAAGYLGVEGLYEWLRDKEYLY